MQETETKEPKMSQEINAGNLGKGQDLYKILPQLTKVLEGRVEFNFLEILGKSLLEDELTSNGVTNVTSSKQI